MNQFISRTGSDVGPTWYQTEAKKENIVYFWSFVQEVRHFYYAVPSKEIEIWSFKYQSVGHLLLALIQGPQSDFMG